MGELEQLRKQNADLLAALQCVMEWIDNWTPNFSYDEEWPVDRAAALDAIAKAKGGAE